MDISALDGLGLSKGETKIYITLLELGETKVGGIIEKSAMASSGVHNSLNSLLEKGFVSYIKKGKIKFYQAVPPKYLIDFLDDKKKKIQEILPELELKRKKSYEKQGSEIFEGTKGIIAMLNLLIEDAKKGDEYIFFSVNVKQENEEIQEFFSMYDIKRKSKGLVIKGLAPKELKKLFKNRKLLKMRYTNFPIPSNISVCKDKTAIFSWEEKPIGYIIKSKQIADMYKQFFDQIWKIAKS